MLTVLLPYTTPFAVLNGCGLSNFFLVDHSFGVKSFLDIKFKLAPESMMISREYRPEFVPTSEGTGGLQSLGFWGCRGASLRLMRDLPRSGSEVLPASKSLLTNARKCLAFRRASRSLIKIASLEGKMPVFGELGLQKNRPLDGLALCLCTISSVTDRCHLIFWVFNF